MTDAQQLLVIGCARSAEASRERLHEMERALPEGTDWLQVPCGSAVDDLLLLRAFEAGAERVLVLVCNAGACRSIDGNDWAEKRTNSARALLEEVGIAGWRLQYRRIGPNMPMDLLSWVEAFHAFVPEEQVGEAE